MSEKLTISVDASETSSELFTVQDVLSHVLDLFELIKQSGTADDDSIVWRLVSASMNSPLTITAEAFAVRPNVQVNEVAQRQKRSFAHNYRELKAGSVPSAWASSSARITVNRVLARNRNQVGITKISGFQAGIEPIEITTEDATVAAIPMAIINAAPIKKSKEQIGSIEGELIKVDRYYGSPAIQIKERKSGFEIWCVVPEDFQHSISESTKVEDVWHGSRVSVRGTISYNNDGGISKVIATNVRRITTKQILEEVITDSTFTSGMGATEYLEKFRDGTLGRA